jgi:cold-inducible RNA-binding protein
MYAFKRQKESNMSNKLFVGGLSWGTDDAALRDAFSEFGDVSDVKVITDRETGRSRGFGFVTFASAAEAKAAISSMDGATLDGRTINVNEAQDRRDDGGGSRGGDRGGRNGGGGGGGGGRGGNGGGGRDNNRW